MNLFICLTIDVMKSLFAWWNAHNGGQGSLDIFIVVTFSLSVIFIMLFVIGLSVL